MIEICKVRGAYFFRRDTLRSTARTSLHALLRNALEYSIILTESGDDDYYLVYGETIYEIDAKHKLTKEQVKRIMHDIPEDFL